MIALTRFALIVIFLSACQQQVAKEKELLKKETRESDIETSRFINEINYPELNIDSVTIGINRISKIEVDFLERQNTRVFSLVFTGSSDTLKIEAASIALYPEEDINLDGIPEIGILPGYKTSACRKYYLYEVKGGKWNKLGEADTHLPDREKGVNYFSVSNQKLKIVSASASCCCQCECLN